MRAAPGETGKGVLSMRLPKAKELLFHLGKGAVNEIPLLGGVLQEVIFSIYEGQQANEESEKLHRSLDEIRGKVESRNASLAEALAGFQENREFRQEMRGLLAQVVAATRHPQRVDLSVINGRVVVEDGHLLTVDLEPVIERHNRISRELVGRR